MTRTLKERSFSGTKNPEIQSREIEHRKIARRAAAEGIVLLKNEDHILPLKQGSSVAIYGAGAGKTIKGGTGSGDVNERENVSVFQGMKNAGFHVTNEAWIESYEKIYDKARQDWKDDILSRTGEGADTMDFFAVYSTTPFVMPAGDPITKPADGENTDTAVYVLSRVAGEGADRNVDKGDYYLNDEEYQMLADICEYYRDVIVVINAGAQVDLSFMDEFSNIKALLSIVQPGMEGGNALADIMSGKVNSSGKLTDSWAYKFEDYPNADTFSHNNGNVDTEVYEEGIYVGYRYFDTFGVPVRYGFGFGLSYTEFTYSDLIIEEDGIKVSVTNTGDRDGAEVVQMYVGLPNAIVFRPEKELKGFAKVYLKAGERRQIRIPFDDKTFRYWNIKTGQWEIETGTYQIMVGASVADIRLTGMTERTGNSKGYPYNPAKMPYYYTGIVQKISDEEFRELLGHEIPNGRWSGNLEINDAICQMYYAKSRLARLIYRCLTKMKKKSEAQGKPDLNILFIYNMPFRGIAKMTGGAVSMEMVYGIVDAVNGHFMLGIKKVVGGYFRNRRNNKKYEKLLKGAGGKCR